MNLNKKSLWLAFTSGCIFTLLLPTIFPSLRLMFFVPFLIILFYQKSFSVCLWCAFFCGLMIDVLSIQPPFGFYACNYTLATAIIYSQKRNFFADHLSTLPIMTFIFSSTATLLEGTFLYIFGAHMSLGLTWVFSDLFIMPACDALYAFLWFIILPLSLQKKSRRRTI